MSKSVPKYSTASAVHGLWFVFEQDGHTFAIWAAELTGKEEVYLDGQLVSARRKIALTSTHTLSVDEREYTITLSTLSVTQGLFQATLARAGAVLQGWQTRYITRRSTVSTIASVVVFATIAFIVLRMDSSPWYLVCGVWLLAVGNFAWTTSGEGYGYVVEPLTV